MSPRQLGMRINPKRPGNVYDWLGTPSKPPRQHPSAATLRRIAEVLGMTTDELLGMAEGQEPPFSAWSEFLQALAGRGDKLSSRERRKLAMMHFEEDEEPTVGTYELQLATFRTTLKKRTPAA